MPSCALVRFVLLHDGRCLSAEHGVSSCSVSLKPCSTADALQEWRLEQRKAGMVVHSPTKEAEWAKHDAECADSSTECVAWASGGECRNNPTYMRTQCRRSCNTCLPKAPCSIWAHRPPPIRSPDGDPSVASSTTLAPMLGLVSNASRRTQLSHMHVTLANWSTLFPAHRFVRAACPNLPQAVCCLESGLWMLGPRNSRVKTAWWHLCSYHEVHMFPYRARSSLLARCP